MIDNLIAALFVIKILLVRHGATVLAMHALVTDLKHLCPSGFWCR